MAIKTRETTADGVTNKGAPLTNAELDNNFVELQQNKLEAADLVAADTSYDNTDSGLVASNVQSAIDEIQDKKLNITDLAANVVFYPTDAASDISTYFKLVTSTEDADYDDTAVDIPTGSITTTDQFIAALASEPGVLEGSTGSISITTVGNVRRTSGSQTADFYFEVYKRDSGGTETLMGTSNSTAAVDSETYEQFYAACLITATTFTATDRVVFKYYGNNLGNPSGSAYSFQFGGSAPVRSNLPVPVNVVSHANDAEDIIVDTSNFNGLLSGADNDVQAALETLDDHNHDSDYATTAQGTNADTAYGWGDHASAGYLTSYTETDPVVGAIAGIVKADGAGNISAAVAGTDYVASETYSSASDLLTAIKTVDGTGSGLDADTLDGNEATAFYLASNPAGYTTNTGTVTSVAATVPTGLTVSGSPITSSGTLAISLDAGYAIPTTTSQTNWDTAYGWGDHSVEGYLTNETDPVVGAITGIVKADGAGEISAATAGTDYLAPDAIGSTIQAYDADTAKYDDTTANFTGTLQNGGSNVVVDTDIGSTVQAYDSNLTSFVGTFTLPNTDGTADQVLTTNGSGVLSFADAAADIQIVATPTNVSPADSATGIGSTPALTGSAFGSLYGFTMAAGQWQVSTVSDFSSTVINTGDVAGTSVTYNVSSGILSTSTTYYWRVRYKNSNGDYSEWSTATSFTTAVAFPPSTIGESYGGGYYAGIITEGGSDYYLIVAPKSTGENSSKKWKTSNDAGPSATQTLNNGPAASASMNSATYPAAQFCEGLSIGGYTDWYLPARDELELCYRNLKPTTGANSTSSRSLSSITYPEGNDVSGDTMGINRNSNPTGSAYTSGTPSQTSVTAFQTGNSEAFASEDYWSSSEYSSTSAWSQGFSSGYQFSKSKDRSVYVRAVRRLPV